MKYISNTYEIHIKYTIKYNGGEIYSIARTIHTYL